MRHRSHSRRFPHTLRACGPAALLLLGVAFPCSARAQNTPVAAPSSTKASPAKPRTISEKQKREADDAYLEGARQLSGNDPAAAERSFARAVMLNPAQTDYALALAVAKEHHVTALVQQAAKARLLGNTKQAQRLVAEADALDPDNAIVKQHMSSQVIPLTGDRGASSAAEELAKLDGPILLQPKAGVQNFKRTGDTQSVLRDVFNAFGIKTAFDASVGSQSIRFDLDDVDYDTATRILLRMTKTFAVPLENKSVLIAKDTPENRDRLIPLVEETFYLPGLPPDQVTELGNVAKNIFDLKQVSVQANSGHIVLRGNEDAVKLLNDTFVQMIDGGADIMLDVNVYEYDKTHTRNIGAQLPNSVGAFSIAAEAQQLIASNQSIITQAMAAGVLAQNASPLQQLEFLLGSGLATIPQFTGLLGRVGGGLSLAGIYLGSGATFNMLLNSTDSRLLDSVQMRVSDNQLGNFRSGTRYPITTATYSSGVSSALTSALSGVKIGGTNAASLLSQYLNTSSTTVPQVQYEDLGLTLKATPQALKSGQIHVHLDLKIEALAGGSLNGIPILNSRQLVSDVTIPPGQTAMLASELSTSEQHSIAGLPGLSEIPGFQGTDKVTEKDTGELLITITPHVVRQRSPIIASRRVLANVGGTIEQ